ncbi:CPBP family intramembrane metalloprotease [Rhodococcus sp. IEGM 1409]|uniref:CPBP family intramembrane glutamic endopeptidase n=1 Tax=Rhodococcus sp. IEGM 1409 TaxID=3047082 RepID=UPI0024B710E8|nr:CPBP family intramembrane glutamic endopeptidase [Rhodococcus sp. IEGM 1409]MDI9903028.1 CPBP family intramembrane metalloprotease [Rhodococcus sp. IEGM 1409]
MRTQEHSVHPRPSIVVPLITFLMVSSLVSPILEFVQASCSLNSDALRLTQFSTLFGAAVVLVGWRGRLPFPAITRSSVFVSAFVTTTAMICVLAGIAVLDRLTDSRWVPIDVSALPMSTVVLGVVALGVGAGAEEIGWRGIVQPLLESRIGPVRAMIVTGAVFGLGHVYVLASGVAVYVLFVVAAMGLSIIFGALTTGLSLGHRTLVATVAHWVLNLGLIVFFSDGDTSEEWMLEMTIAVMAVSAVVLVLRLPSLRVVDQWHSDG